MWLVICKLWCCGILRTQEKSSCRSLISLHENKIVKIILGGGDTLLSVLHYISRRTVEVMRFILYIIHRNVNPVSRLQAGCFSPLKLFGNIIHHYERDLYHFTGGESCYYWKKGCCFHMAYPSHIIFHFNSQLDECSVKMPTVQANYPGKSLLLLKRSL